MNKKEITLVVVTGVIMIAVLIFGMGYITQQMEKEATGKAYQEGYEQAIKWSNSQPRRTWRCKMVVTCPQSDWSVTEPQEVCEYETKIISSITEPDPNKPYGGYCELMTP